MIGSHVVSILGFSRNKAILCLCGFSNELKRQGRHGLERWEPYQKLACNLWSYDHQSHSQVRRAHGSPLQAIIQSVRTRAFREIKSPWLSWFLVFPGYLNVSFSSRKWGKPFSPHTLCMIGWWGEPDSLSLRSRQNLAYGLKPQTLCKAVLSSNL